VTQRRRPHFLLVFFPLAFVGIAVIVWLGLTGKHDPGAAQAHADFARISEALAAYRADHPSLPEEGDLSFLVPKYLPAVPVDPFGNPYGYASNGDRPFLQSYGRDGVRGGNGPDQDHTTYDGHAVLAPR
jgi:general secretion pathway protein G